MASWKQLALAVFGQKPDTTYAPAQMDANGNLLSAQGPPSINANAWPVLPIINGAAAGTASNPVSVKQGTAAALAQGWPVNITDGVSILGTVTNPVQIAGSVAASGATLNITPGLSVTNYDLSVAAYNVNSAISGPYKLNCIKFHFSTPAAKTITITDATTGALLASPSSTTSTDYLVPVGGIGFPASHQFNVTVTQTGGACSMTFSAEIETGQLPMGGNPVLGSPIPNTYIGSVDIARGRMIDASGRLRTSEPTTIADHKHLYDTGPLVYGDYGTGTSTFDFNTSSVILALGATANGLIQTHIKHAPVPYQPNKSQKQTITTIMGSAVANVVKRIGLTVSIAHADAIYLRQNGTASVDFVIESTAGGTTPYVAPKSSWSIDKFDGTGPSGLTLDLSKDIIFIIDFQWLSGGTVRFGFEINGQVWYAHEYNTSNFIAFPFVHTPVLRPFWQIENVGVAGSATSMKAICSSSISEGGRTVIGRSESISTGPTTIAAANTAGLTPVLAIRPRLTYNTFLNHVIGSLLEFNLLTDNDALYRIIYFPTSITGGTWTAVPGSSAFEYNTTMTAVTGGDQFKEDFIPSAAKTTTSVQTTTVQEQELMTLTGDDTGQIAFVIMARGLGAVANVRASMRWLEERE